MRQFLNEDYLIKILPVFCSKSIKKVIDVVYQLCVFLDQEILLMIIDISVISYGLLNVLYLGLDLKSIQKFQLVQIAIQTIIAAP